MFFSSFIRSRIDVDQGHFIKIAVNHEVVQLLSSEDNCVDSYTAVEAEFHPDVPPSDHKVEDSYDGCIYSELRKLNLLEVGCTVPWLPDKDNICQEESKRKEAFEIYQKNRRNQVDFLRFFLSNRMSKL